MMCDIFEEEIINRSMKKKKNLSKSVVFGQNINSARLLSDIDIQDYLDDFLQHSKGAVFIKGNDNNHNTVKNKKNIKKRKAQKSSDIDYIMNGIVYSYEEESKDNKEKEIKEKEKKEKEKEKEEKERESKVKKDKERKEKKEKEEKEKKEKVLNEHKKKKLIKKIIKEPKIQVKQKEEEKNDEYMDFSIKRSYEKNNGSNYINYLTKISKQKSIKSKSANPKEITEEKQTFKSSKISLRKKMIEEEIKKNEKNYEDENEENDEENEKYEQKEESQNEKEEENEEEEEKNNEYKKEPKKKANNKIKKTLKEQLEKFENDQNLIVCSKYYDLFKKNIIKGIKNILKTLFIFQSIKNCQIKSVQKISSIYRGYAFRQKFKLYYLTLKILKIREQYASKISSYYRMYQKRKDIKNLIQKTEDHYVIYSSLNNNNQLYFKYKYQNGSDNNLYFEFCPLLKCFILFVNKREKKNNKILEGCFYNENYNIMLDPLYEQNQKGENIINFQKIFEKIDSLDEKKDIIINRYMKLHRSLRRRERIDDYEERKRKALDDDNPLSNSQTFKIRKFDDKVKKISRSKSFMKLKGSMKSILKPSKSYINLRCEDKKIHFGVAKIKKYHNLKK